MMMNEWINFLFFPFNFLCRYCFVVAVYDVFGVYDVVYDVVLCKFRTYVCCVWCCVWYCLYRCLLHTQLLIWFNYWSVQFFCSTWSVQLLIQTHCCIYSTSVCDLIQTHSAINSITDFLHTHLQILNWFKAQQVLISLIFCSTWSLQLLISCILNFKFWVLSK